MTDAGTVQARNCQGETSLFINGRLFRFRGNLPTSFWGSLLKLIGHLIGTAVIFVVFLLLTWAISYSVSGLDTVHKFPQDVMNIITKVELGLTYIDIVLCTIVLILGTVRFCVDLMENRYE